MHCKPFHPRQGRILQRICFSQSEACNYNADRNWRGKTRPFGLLAFSTTVFFCRVSLAVSTLSCSWVSEDVAKKNFAKHYEHCTFGREVLALPISVAMVSTVVIPMAILAAVCSRSTQKLTQANTTIK